VTSNELYVRVQIDCVMYIADCMLIFCLKRTGFSFEV